MARLYSFELMSMLMLSSVLKEMGVIVIPSRNTAPVPAFPAGSSG